MNTIIPSIKDINSAKFTVGGNLFNIDATKIVGIFISNIIAGQEPGKIVLDIMEQIPESQKSTSTQIDIQNFVYGAITCLGNGSENSSSVGYELPYKNKVENGAPDFFLINTWDPVTNDRILELDPSLQRPVMNFINDAEKKLGLHLRVAQGFRTIAQQDALYAQGITPAKGGESAHNYGLAVDVLPIENGKILADVDWQAIGQLGKDHGFKWGGDWKGKKKDLDHFQMGFWK